jgi:putative membrane protein
MKRKAETFFSPDEKDRIKKSIELAENTTSGEIAIMVVDDSDSYREAATLGAIVLSGFVALMAEIAGALVMYADRIWTHSTLWAVSHSILEITEHLTVWTYIPIVFLLYFPCKYALIKLPSLKIRFLTGRRIDETVRERAIRAFYEKGLYRTRDETGILIFISLLEHRVWILGDRGINAKIRNHFWEERAAELTSGIRNKQHGKAVLEVISQCGNELAKHFPKKHDDTNELTDEVIL